MILRWEVFATMMALCSFFGTWIGMRAKNIAAGVLTAWILMSASMVAFNPSLVSSIIDMKLRVVAAKSFCLILLGLVFITVIDRIWVNRLFLLFECLAVVETALLLVYGVGLFSADSMDATFVACVYAVTLLRPKRISTWFRFILVGFPMFIFFAPRLGNTMFLVLAGMAGTYFFLKRQILFLLIVPVFLFFISSLLSGAEFLHYIDRTEPWKLFMKWLWESDKFWLGTGTGTFQWVGPILQNKADNLFIWFHNEYLQIIFEQGLFGFGLAGILIYQCLKKTVKVPWLFIANVGLLISFMTQFPLRYPVGHLYALLLIRASLLEEMNDSSEYQP